ncbi:DUF5999 family protein [Streptomyces globisporus]|uniref:DUF5999 family protein n=1 Tax=Streptomyces globisporus TaxID=1908 RepID=UPI0036DED28E
MATVPTTTARAAGTCRHTPPCPDATSPDRDTARSTARHAEQGWSLLCNGILLFEDTGELLPDGQIVEPRRGPTGDGAGAER